MKKNPKEFDQLTKEYYENIQEKGLSYNLCNYVWSVLVAYSRGYGFNSSHTLAYSLIALQEMNLAFKFPIAFWNCACLISDSGSGLPKEETDSEDEEEEESEEKEKKKTTDYGKIATAIGKMKAEGITIVPPDINKSLYTFSPDIDNNSIVFGLNGITRVGASIVQEILKEREKGLFTSFKDFLTRTNFNRLIVLNLIKCGAFDQFGEREQIMNQYISYLVPGRKALSIASAPTLLKAGLIQDENILNLIKIYNFNKFLSKNKSGLFYQMDDYCFNFYENMNFDIDAIFQEDGIYKIKQKVWDSIYTPYANRLRNFIKENKAALIEELNRIDLETEKKKYCEGTYSTWEMDSISCYIHPHELINLNERKYNIVDFFGLDDNSEIDRIVTYQNRQFPLYKIYRIAGTVLDKDKLKNSVTVLTTSGVVTVKLYGDAFSKYDKQVAEVGADGKKHIIEKSYFSRGTKIIVTGIRRGNEFVCKKYKNTPYHLIEKINTIEENGNCEITVRE